MIIELNKQPVAGVQEFRDIYKKAGKSALALVYRGSRTRYVALGR